MTNDKLNSILAPSLQNFSTIASTIMFRPAFKDAVVQEVYDTIYRTFLQNGASAGDAETVAFACSDYVERYADYLAALPHGGAA